MISVVSPVTLQQHPVTSLAVSFSLHLTDSQLFLWSSWTFEWPSMKNGEETHKQHPEPTLILPLPPWLTSQISYWNTLKKKPIRMCSSVFKWSPVAIRIVPRSSRVVMWASVIIRGLQWYNHYKLDLIQLDRGQCSSNERFVLSHPPVLKWS